MTSREQVKASIRAEIDRQRPVEVARRTLELLAESAVRAVDAPPGYQVVGRDGAPRVHRQGDGERPFTLADLFDELRRQHPSLFLPPAPVTPVTPPETAAAAVSEPLRADAAEAGSGRDWMRLDRAPAGTASAPARPAASRAAKPAGALARLARGFAARRAAPARQPAAAPAADAAPAAPSGEGLKPAVTRPTRTTRPGPARRPLVAALGLVALVGAGAWLLSGSEPAAPPPTAAVPAAPVPETKSAAAPRRDPVETGTLVPDEAPPQKSASLAGVAEVVDTATLKLGGKTLRLFGVETARGAQPQDLTSYLAGRPVACQPATNGSAYTCTVDGHDLSEVVLYNGGGRATSEATSDLVEAERHARTEKLGIWRR
ncbi:thermonuclease family protein [Methylobacterium sp. ID0610]|uniref:thermonuclease family protein n=1 Tax=Methylobacterium carpenticola TaxID=3344827 RepID=UPI0036D0B547